MTEFQIMQKLDLLPWDIFKELSRETNSKLLILYPMLIDKKALQNRRTGRTTKIIIQALVTASLGHDIAFTAHSLQIAQSMQKIAKEYAVICGIAPNRFKFAINRKNLQNIMGSKVKIFDDHF